MRYNFNRTLIANIVVAIALNAPIPANCSDAVVWQPNSRIKAVAVISAIGDELNVAEVGAFNFNRGRYLIPIQDWNIDDHIAGTISAILAKQFSTVALTYDRTAFEYQKVSGWTFDEPPVKKLTAALAAPVDAYLVVSKKAEFDDYQRRNDIGGLNIYKETTVFLGARYSTFILVDVQLIDSKTNATLAESSIHLGPDVRWADQTNTIDPALWPDETHHLTSDQLAKLREIFATRLDAAIVASLRDMGLGR